MRATADTGSRGSAITQQIFSVQRFLICALIAGSSVSAMVGIVHPQAFFLTFGLLGLTAVLLPVRHVQEPLEILPPWILIIGSVLIGVTARGAYLAFGVGEDAELNHLFLLGHPPEYFALPGVLVLVSLVLVGAGYFSPPSRRFQPARLTRALSRRVIDPRSLHVVVLACSVAAVVGFVLFAQETGGLDLLEPSRKRAVSPGLEAEDSYRGLGYLRFMASLGATGYLALLAYYAATRRRIGPPRVVLLAVMFLNASLLPFYGSARGDILWLVLLSGAVLLITGHRLRGRWIVGALAIMLIVLHVMSILRSQGEVSAIVPSFGGGRELVDSIVLDRNLVDITKTAHVMDALPERLDYKYGQTILTSVVAPIPRELWPGKPVIQPGPEVGIKVYGTKRSGVPPGFVAEMYWNFHILGVVLGSFLLGWGLRALNEKLRPRGSSHPAVILLYVVGVMPVGMTILGGAFGPAAFNAFINVAQVLGIVWLSTRSVVAASPRSLAPAASMHGA